MDEVRSSGPVTCTINITQGFLNYKDGILKDSGETGIANHHISITGWGVEGGVKYWRGRNSWGSQWGEGGDFRIIRSQNFMNIEKNCSWAVPIDTWTKDIRNDTKKENA
jgi:cathepsin X